MEHKVEIVYCKSEKKYYIIDNLAEQYSYSYVTDNNIGTSKCPDDTIIKDNLTRKEAEIFLLSILKLKGL